MFLVLGLFGSLPLHFLFFFPFFPLFFMFNSEENVEVAYRYPRSKERAKTGKEIQEGSASISSVGTHPSSLSAVVRKKGGKKRKKRNNTKKKEGEQTTRVDIIVSSTKKMLKICVSFIIQLNLKASYCLMIVLLDTANLSSIL